MNILILVNTLVSFGGTAYPRSRSRRGPRPPGRGGVSYRGQDAVQRGYLYADARHGNVSVLRAGEAAWEVVSHF